MAGLVVRTIVGALPDSFLPLPLLFHLVQVVPYSAASRRTQQAVMSGIVARYAARDRARDASHCSGRGGRPYRYNKGKGHQNVAHVFILAGCQVNVG